MFCRNLTLIAAALHASHTVCRSIPRPCPHCCCDINQRETRGSIHVKHVYESEGIHGKNNVHGLWVRGMRHWFACDWFNLLKIVVVGRQNNTAASKKTAAFQWLSRHHSHHKHFNNWPTNIKLVRAEYTKLIPRETTNPYLLLNK